jgi:amino acid adenylation domain-containing protein
LWFLDQLEPGGPSSSVLQAIRLDGALKVKVLQRALDAVVAHHWSLHTTFVTLESGPVQIIVKDETARVQVGEISQALEQRSEAELLQQGIKAMQRPFDLAHGPLLRASLLHLKERQHILLIAMHPIISDRKSMRIFLEELAGSYETQLAGRPSLPADLSSQYVDFAIWQRQWLQTEASEEQLSYWKQQLQGAPGLLEMPTDRPRPAVQTFSGARHRLLIPKSLGDSLSGLCRGEDVTLYITLLAAFQTLLSRCTGEENIVVGTSTEGRQVETQELIGPFVNPLALRTDLSGNPSFREVLGRVREVTEGAYAHQDMPFEKLVEELRPERSLSHAPLFQVMFELQDGPQQILELPGLDLTPIDMETGRAETDLTLSVVKEADGLTASFEYNTDLFDATTMARLVSHYQTLLEGIVANPEGHLWDLPLLSDGQRHQIVIEWNTNNTEYPKDACIQQLFEAQVNRTPDQIAVQCEGRQLTYAELNRKANQLAHYLVGHGVGPEVLVGVCTGRSMEMIVGLLGILKAGGAYVPLDPTYPRDRLSFMLEDSEVSVLLTQEALLKSLPAHRAETLLLDTHLGCVASESEENVVSEASAENLAYVIYTSGSTGRPKGVAIQHCNSVAFLHWAGNVFTPEQIAGVLASTSICFDLSIFELFVPLCWGGMVILTENVLHLKDSPTAENVSLINTVPSAMAELVRVQGLPGSVRTINLAGEPLQNKLAQQIYQQSRVQQVFNLYGPTEDTTYSTFALVRRGTGNPPSIGRPIDNTSIYLLDRHLQPVPVGIVGELYIGGAGLARGYLNHPDLTAEKFIPNPFGEGEQTRLYKTGDLARYLVDGHIEFLGRTDKQVKLRGYRIELGEIEAILVELPGIHESVVVVTDDELAEKSLVAYVVFEPGQVLTSGELRTTLKQKLPEYMVPSAFVFLDELPLTPNGKVDRRALPPPHAMPELESSSAAPHTSTEKVLAEIWCEVLKLKRVGIQDNFFELGGHSLLATRVMARMREAFQVEVPLRVLFEVSTVAGLAIAIDEAVVERLDSGKMHQRFPLSPEQQRLTSPVPGRPAPRETRDPVPLSFAQQRLWFFDQLEPGSSAYNVPAVFHLAGSLHLNALERSLSEIVRRHEVLRTVFRSVNGNPVQVVTPPRDLPLKVIDLEATPEPERQATCRQRVVMEVNRPFDLSADCMLRVCLLRLGQAEHILVLTLHHIASDGWSIVILLEELKALYNAYACRKAVTARRITHSVRGFCSLAAGVSARRSTRVTAGLLD